MLRYFEYTDENDKRWGAMQNAPDATRQKANELLSHTARIGRWRDVEAFPANMPEWEIKRRMNAVQAKNNEPPLFEESETKEPALRTEAGIITLTDHADNTTIQTPILPTGPARPMPEPVAGAIAIPITDHAEPEPARG